MLSRRKTPPKAHHIKLADKPAIVCSNTNATQSNYLAACLGACLLFGFEIVFERKAWATTHQSTTTSTTAKQHSHQHNTYRHKPHMHHTHKPATRTTTKPSQVASTSKPSKNTATTAAATTVAASDKTPAQNHATTDQFITSSVPICSSKSKITSTINSLLHNNPSLNQDMIRLGVHAYCYAEQHSSVPLHNNNHLTLIDFTEPSYMKRLFVIDLNSMKVTLALNVAHGKNSGLTKAAHFSNQPKSLETSLGVYTTGSIYFGKHGKSLRLNGLEKGINDNALRRDVVMHCAPYVSDEFIKTHHRAGRSWGCFAVSPAVCAHLVELLKGGSVIFAYGLPELKDKNLTSP